MFETSVLVIFVLRSSPDHAPIKYRCLFSKKSDRITPAHLILTCNYLDRYNLSRQIIYIRVFGCMAVQCKFNGTICEFNFKLCVGTFSFNLSYSVDGNEFAMNIADATDPHVVKAIKETIITRVMLVRQPGRLFSLL